MTDTPYPAPTPDERRHVLQCRVRRMLIRGDDQLQRDRRRDCDHGWHGGEIDGAGRLRPRLDDRGQFGSHRRLAVLRALIPQARERTVLRAIALSFFVLAAYVAIESILRPARGARGRYPRPSESCSWRCHCWSCCSSPTRNDGPAVSWVHATAVADSRQTLLCTYLSAVLLVGLIANAAFLSWWADPIAWTGHRRRRTEGRTLPHGAAIRAAPHDHATSDLITVSA